MSNVDEIVYFRFLYCEEADIDLNNVISVLQAAKKYSVQALIDKCMYVLKRGMVPENVCTVLECADKNDDDQLWWKCFDFIKDNTTEVFKSDSLVDLCSQCLGDILRENEFSMQEEDIFEAVLRYGNKQCEITGTENTPFDIRNVLGDCLDHVRFPLMDPVYFVVNVDTLGILEDKDSLILNRYFLRKVLGLNPQCERFKTDKRKTLDMANRFTRIASGWTYKRDNPDAICFECSRDILLRGVQIYGTCQTPGDLRASLKLFLGDRDTLELAERTVRLECDGNRKTWNILFENPVTIPNDTEFTLVLSCNGSPTFYGENGQEKISTHDGVEFRFSNSKRSKNNTNITTGQIPVLVYELKDLACEQAFSNANDIAQARYLTEDERKALNFVERDNRAESMSVSESLRQNRHFLRKLLGLVNRNQIFRFRVTVSGSSDKHRENSDAISFETSRDILLVGVQIYGTCQRPGTIKGSLQLFSEGKTIQKVEERTVHLKCDGNRKTWNILWENLVHIPKRTKFSVVLNCNGPETFIGESGVELIEDHHGIEFHFSNSRRSAGNTNVRCGQIPGLIYRIPVTTNEMKASGGIADLETSESSDDDFNMHALKLEELEN